jgi:hypothetical protein
LLAERAFAASAKHAYTEAMRTAWKKIRYRLEWLRFGLGSEWGYPQLEGNFFFSFRLRNPMQTKDTIH